MLTITVWACNDCGRCGEGAHCETCDGNMAQMAEPYAIHKFMIRYEPPKGWHDYATLRREWVNTK